MGERQGELAEKLFGDQEILAQLGAEALYSGGGIQNVAVVGHFATEVAHFRGNHLAAVYRSLEIRCDSVLAQELAAGVEQSFLKVEVEVQGAGLLLAFLGAPGDEHAVACELVDFAMVFFAAVGKQAVVVANEVTVLHVAQFLANAGGGTQVDKHEHQVFFHRFLGLAQQGVPEHSAAELLVHGTDEGNNVAQDEECGQLNLEAGSLHGIEQVLEAILIHDAFAGLDAHQQNAEGEVCHNGANEVDGADHHGGPYGAAVHFVLQDHDVVDAVGETHEQCELQLEEYGEHVDGAILAVGTEYGQAYGANHPAYDVVAYAPKLTFCLS